MEFASGWEYRLPVYIALGIVCEVLFTATIDIISPNFLKSWNVFGKDQTKDQPSWRVSGRDPRFMGYTFLWMLPIYCLLIFMEPVSKWLSEWPIFLRGILYVFALWLVEYIFGWLIKKISGRVPWDYQMAKTSIHGYVRLDFFFFWFGFMLFVEWFSQKLVLLTPALKEVFS